MIGITHVGKGHGAGLVLDANIGLGEKNMIRSETGAEGHAQFRVILKREIIHQVDVDGFAETTGGDCIRNTRPSGIAYLKNEVVIGPVGQIWDIFFDLGNGYRIKLLGRKSSNYENREENQDKLLHIQLYSGQM